LTGKVRTEINFPPALFGPIVARVVNAFT
jgi:hypothetical protein